VRLALASVLLASIATAALVLAAPGRARADDAADARRLFDQATPVLRARRFAEARDLLRRSLTLHPSAATAFNLAVALRGTGETTEAVATFDSVLGGRFGTISSDEAAQVGRLRAETARDLGTLEIQASGAPQLELIVDGAAAATIDDRSRIVRQVDAGRHRVEARATDGRHAEREIDVERGATAPVVLVLPAAPAPRAEPARAQVLDEPRRGGGHASASVGDEGDGGSSSAVWWIAGGVVVAAGVAIVAWLLLSGGADPTTDPIWGRTGTLEVAP